MKRHNKEYLPTVPNGAKWSFRATLTFGTPPVALSTDIPAYTNPPASINSSGLSAMRQLIVDTNFLRVNAHTLQLAVGAGEGDWKIGDWAEL
jgi:hypothetical protein